MRTSNAGFPAFKPILPQNGLDVSVLFGSWPAAG
jgi:hypothetical protein